MQESAVDKLAVDQPVLEEIWRGREMRAEVGYWNLYSTTMICQL